MPGNDIITRTVEPLSAAALAEHRRACGLAEGQSVLVHIWMEQHRGFRGRV